LLYVSESPDLLTTQEVAEFLRVSRVTVVRWVRDGTLPGVKIGGVLRFRRSDIEALIPTEDPEAAA
jgi:PTS system nitrogen regulatory IIA component